MRRIIGVGIIILLLAGIMSFMGCVSKGDYEQLQSRLQNVETSLQNTAGQAALLQARVSDLEETLLSTNATLNRTHERLTNTQSELAITRLALSDSQRDLDSTRKTLNDVQKWYADDEAKLKLYQDRLGITLYSGMQPPYNRIPRTSSQINLTTNQSAVDPTWDELVHFIQTDNTDMLPYVNNVFMCGGFAEAVYNNAAAQGIRSAFVAVHFSDGTLGHALNAFMTTDRGLVYIDCTGRGQQSVMNTGSASLKSWDKIAYLAKNRELGTLALTASANITYDFYAYEKAKWDSFMQKMAGFNRDITRFNADTKGKIFYIDTAEWFDIKKREADLMQRAKELETIRAGLIDMWSPLGIVDEIEFYW